MAPQRIAIIGGGINALTCAFRLKETFPDFVITVFSDEYSPYTTGDISAGYWQPFLLETDDAAQRNRVLKWAKDTYNRFIKESRLPTASICGVHFMGSYFFSDSESDMDPFWSKAVLNYNSFTADDLRTFGLEFVKCGFHFTTTVVDVKKYLPFLMNILESNGVKFIKAKIKSFTDLQIEDTASSYQYIINCSGLGARELCQDQNVYPIRGQVLRVEAPWIKTCMNFEQRNHNHTYILPGSNYVVLGGTAEENVYSTQVNERDAKEIFNKCRRLMPSLENAKIVQTTAGLRPARKGGVRLELEVIKNDKGTIKVIHNYGHSGSGVTLCWGCANEVLDILKDDLKVFQANL